MASIFFSYSHKDESLRNELETHLAMLKREGLITSWHDRKITAGDEFAGVIDEKLNTAEIILLLVSSDFLASGYCYDIEVQQAMARHEAGMARVIPIILRPCEWTRAPFGRLLAAPTDGKPISKWADRDEAFLDVVRQIRAALPKTPREPSPSPRPAVRTRHEETTELPRSSNLRLRQSFTDADKDRFLDEAFEFIARFFEGSLEELQKRHPEIETRFRRIDAHSFSAAIYRHGKKKTACSVHQGGRRGFTGGITFSYDESSQANSFNEALNVEVGEQALSLKPMGMQSMLSGQNKGHLTSEGGAEFFWSMLIEPLQR
ncbi:toll/interleukin-1 receptor domain-containing protein [Prosthecobacter vanneervenii]|uniref:TIR domain-containing protein n=1 Tax=Prosthecobacter vanneervenii TaxID=48466 RepID=A0A7W7YG62_9BACT|nr:toll/interleukin-1 receptor domain-containing protein [Prosthecobacter vanneervenii]MBB5035572.1 hypothetical protein [Prosthecobacter vanneervenii]